MTQTQVRPAAATDGDASGALEVQPLRSQQAAFGSKMRRVAVERWASDSAQQHRLGSQTAVQSVFGKRIVALHQCRPTHIFADHVHLVAKNISYALKNTKSFFTDFWTDAIARQGSDL